jgi:hypothetical protein
MNCENFRKLKEWSAMHLKKALLEHRYYESEREGHDIGDTEAEKRFLASRYFGNEAIHWREEFCGTLCECRESCELGRAIIERDHTSEVPYIQEKEIQDR